MTLTTLITLNAVLAVAAVYALVHLLAHGVHHDRRTHEAHAERIPLRREAHEDRLAA